MDSRWASSTTSTLGLPTHLSRSTGFPTLIAMSVGKPVLLDKCVGKPRVDVVELAHRESIGHQVADQPVEAGIQCVSLIGGDVGHVTRNPVLNPSRPDPNLRDRRGYKPPHPRHPIPRGLR